MKQALSLYLSEVQTWEAQAGIGFGSNALGFKTGANFAFRLSLDSTNEASTVFVSEVFQAQTTKQSLVLLLKIVVPLALQIFVFMQ